MDSSAAPSAGDGNPTDGLAPQKRCKRKIQPASAELLTSTLEWDNKAQGRVVIVSGW